MAGGMALPEVWEQRGGGIQRPGKERARGRVRWSGGGVGSGEVEMGEANSYLQTQKCVCKAWHNPFWLQPVSPVGTGGWVWTICGRP